MSTKYYYLIAGLPDVAMDDSKPVCSPESFRAEYYGQLSAADRKLVDLLYLETDNRNLLALMADKQASVEEGGLYTVEELQEVIDDARAEDRYRGECPRYMYEFVQRQASAEGLAATGFASDVLAGLYYAYAASTKNTFVNNWFRFNLNMNNVLSALTARKYHLDVATAVVGDGEIAEALRTNSARDFGLTGTMDEYDDVARIADIADLVEREHKIDAIRWNWVEEQSFFDYFTVEKLIAFLVKGQIARRWALLDPEEGGRMLRGMIQEMKNVNVPAEFRVNK